MLCLIEYVLVQGEESPELFFTDANSAAVTAGVTDRHHWEHPGGQHVTQVLGLLYLGIDHLSCQNIQQIHKNTSVLYAINTDIPSQT